MTTKELVKLWPVIVGVVSALVYLVVVSVNVGRIQSDHEHVEETATNERTVLKEEDKRLHKRIDKTDKRASRLKKKVESTSETVVRIETNQSTIIRNQEKILDKILEPK